MHGGVTCLIIIRGTWYIHFINSDEELYYSSLFIHPQTIWFSSHQHAINRYKERCSLSLLLWFGKNCVGDDTFMDTTVVDVGQYTTRMGSNWDYCYYQYYYNYLSSSSIYFMNQCHYFTVFSAPPVVNVS